MRVSDHTSISFGNRYSSPAEPKSTRINVRPKFSMSLTKVPRSDKRTPVLCDRITLVILSESPGFIHCLPVFLFFFSQWELREFFGRLMLYYHAVGVIFPRIRFH